jgi:hypothetical protein
MSIHQTQLETSSRERSIPSVDFNQEQTTLFSLESITKDLQSLQVKKNFRNMTELNSRNIPKKKIKIEKITSSEDFNKQWYESITKNYLTKSRRVIPTSRAVPLPPMSEREVPLKLKKEIMYS